MDPPGQSLEELSHRHEVELIRAVEDDALDRESFGQILRRLRLPGAGRARRCSAELQVEGAGEGEIATVGQWGDH